MAIIAYAGEEIKGRDGKVIATIAEDIHSGDFNFRPSQFNFAEGNQGGFVPEDILEYMRGKMSSPSPEPKVEKPAPKPAKAKATAKAKPAEPAKRVEPAKAKVGQIATAAKPAKRK